ncbi:Ig-like domain-containing protein, partial [Tenacibaculum soleae]|uniref:Ig-like domain-containing protein n=1 Tax=Tenacibaculum soleae TaxID=447689 RepID=UPI0022FFFC66
MENNYYSKKIQFCNKVTISLILLLFTSFLVNAQATFNANPTAAAIAAELQSSGVIITTPVITRSGSVSNQATTASNATGDFQNPAVASCNCPFASGVDTDGDGLDDTCDLDDDNDGILDIDELECSSGFVDLGKSFNRNDTGTNGGTAIATLSDIYTFGSVDIVTATFEVQGVSEWARGVISENTVGVSGDYISTQPFKTDFPNGDVAVYIYTFSEPVYNVSFKLGGLDNQDRADFIAENAGENVGVTLTDINLGANGTFRGQSVISDASSGNAPNNAVQISINGPVTEIKIIVGKQNGNGGNVTMQFYELEYCIERNSDGDGVPNHLDVDSDGDGCYDAIEGDEDVELSHLVASGIHQGRVDTAANGGVNSNGVPDLVNISGTADGANDDQGQGVGVSTVVNPAPNAGAISGGTSVCTTKTLNLSSDGDAGGVWSSSDIARATVDASGVVTGMSSGTVTITYTITSAGGCIDESDVVVTVNETPTASITNDHGLALSCTTPSTTLTASGGTSYSWSDGSTVVGTNAGLTVTTAGTFTVT